MTSELRCAFSDVVDSRDALQRCRLAGPSRRISVDPQSPDDREVPSFLGKELDNNCTMMHSTAMLPFTVKLGTGSSVYQQLVYAVQKAIISNELAPGDRFPSVRTLSQELRINPNTAQKVVTRLVDQGLLDVQPGIGTVVAQLPEPSPRERTALLVHEVEQLVVEARRLSLTMEQVIEAIQLHWTLMSETRPSRQQVGNASKEAIKK